VCAIRHYKGLTVCASLSANNVESYVTVRKLLVTIFDTLAVFISWETQAHWVNTSVRSACDITAGGHFPATVQVNEHTNTHTRTNTYEREMEELLEKIYKLLFLMRDYL